MRPVMRRCAPVPEEVFWSVPLLNTGRKRPWKAPQQKTPRRGGGALLGLLQGGEICISIYVDRWEVGGPLCADGADVVGSNESHVDGAEPNRKVLCLLLIVSCTESLSSIRTYVRFICDSGPASRSATR